MRLALKSIVIKSTAIVTLSVFLLTQSGLAAPIYGRNLRAPQAVQQQTTGSAIGNALGLGLQKPDANAGLRDFLAITDPLFAASRLDPSSLAAYRRFQHMMGDNIGVVTHGSEMALMPVFTDKKEQGEKTPALYVFEDFLGDFARIEAASPSLAGELAEFIHKHESAHKGGKADAEELHGLLTQVVSAFTALGRKFRDTVTESSANRETIGADMRSAAVYLYFQYVWRAEKTVSISGVQKDGLYKYLMQNPAEIERVIREAVNRDFDYLNGSFAQIMVEVTRVGTEFQTALSAKGSQTVSTSPLTVTTAVGRFDQRFPGLSPNQHYEITRDLPGADNHCRLTAQVEGDVYEGLLEQTFYQLSGGYDGFGIAVSSKIVAIESSLDGVNWAVKDALGNAKKIIRAGSMLIHSAKKKGNAAIIGGGVIEQAKQQLIFDIEQSYAEETLKISDGAKMEYDKQTGEQIITLGNEETGFIRVKIKQKGGAHTRWASQGPVTDENTHLFRAVNRKIGLELNLGHNGNLENITAWEPILLQIMQAPDMEGPRFSFDGQTDSERFAYIVALMSKGKRDRPVALNIAVRRAMQAFYYVESLNNAIEVLESDTVNEQARAALQEFLIDFMKKILKWYADYLHKENIAGDSSLEQQMQEVAGILEKVTDEEISRQQAIEYAKHCAYILRLQALVAPEMYDNIMDLKRNIYEAISAFDSDGAIINDFFNQEKYSEIAVCVLSNKSDEVVMARGIRGGNLIVSPKDEKTGIRVTSSENRAFARRFSRQHPDEQLNSYGRGLLDIITIGAMEIAVMGSEGNVRFIDAAEGRQVEKEPKTVLVDRLGFKQKYPTWLQQEIYNQRYSWQRTYKTLVDMETGLPNLSGFPFKDEDLAGITDWYLIGIGTSNHLAQIISILNASETGIRFHVRDGRQVMANTDKFLTDISSGQGRIMVSAISNSGETQEIADTLRMIDDLSKKLKTAAEETIQNRRRAFEAKYKGEKEALQEELITCKKTTNLLFREHNNGSNVKAKRANLVKALIQRGRLEEKIGNLGESERKAMERQNELLLQRADILTSSFSNVPGTVINNLTDGQIYTIANFESVVAATASLTTAMMAVQIALIEVEFKKELAVIDQDLAEGIIDNTAAVQRRADAEKKARVKTREVGEAIEVLLGKGSLEALRKGEEGPENGMFIKYIVRDENGKAVTEEDDFGRRVQMERVRVKGEPELVMAKSGRLEKRGKIVDLGYKKAQAKEGEENCLYVKILKAVGHILRNPRHNDKDPRVTFYGLLEYKAVCDEAKLKVEEELGIPGINSIASNLGKHGPYATKQSADVDIVFCPTDPRVKRQNFQVLNELKPRSKSGSVIVFVNEDDEDLVREARQNQFVDVIISVPHMDHSLVGTMAALVAVHLLTLEASMEHFGMIKEKIAALNLDFEKAKGKLESEDINIGDTGDLMHLASITAMPFNENMGDELPADLGSTLGNQIVSDLDRLCDRLPAETIPSLINETVDTALLQIGTPEVSNLDIAKNVLDLIIGHYSRPTTEALEHPLMRFAKNNIARILALKDEYKKAAAILDDIEKAAGTDFGLTRERVEKEFLRIARYGLIPEDAVQLVDPDDMGSLLFEDLNTRYKNNIAKKITGVTAGAPLTLSAPASASASGTNAEIARERGWEALGSWWVTPEGTMISDGVDLSKITGFLSGNCLVSGSNTVIEKGSIVTGSFVDNTPVRAMQEPNGYTAVGFSLLRFDPERKEEWELSAGSPYRVSSRSTEIMPGCEIDDAVVLNAIVGRETITVPKDGFPVFIADAEVGENNRIWPAKLQLAKTGPGATIGNYSFTVNEERQTVQTLTGVVEVTDFVSNEPNMQIGQRGYGAERYVTYVEGFHGKAVTWDEAAQDWREWNIPHIFMRGADSIALEFSGTLDPSQNEIDRITGKEKSGHGILFFAPFGIFGPGAKIIGALDYSSPREPLNTTQDVLNKVDRTITGPFSYIPGKVEEEGVDGEAWGRIGAFARRRGLSPSKEDIGWILEHSYAAILAQMELAVDYLPEGDKGQLKDFVELSIATEIKLLQDELGTLKTKTDKKSEARKVQIENGIALLQKHLLSGAWKFDDNGEPMHFKKTVTGMWKNMPFESGKGVYAGDISKQFTLVELMSAQEGKEYPRNQWEPPFTQEELELLQKRALLMQQGNFAVENAGFSAASSAIIEEGVVIGSGAVIGPNCTVRAGAEIGANTVLSGGSEIGANAKVGDGSMLFNIIMEPGTFVGNGCKLSKGMVKDTSIVGNNVELAYFKVSGRSEVGDKTNGSVTAIINGSNLGTATVLEPFSVVSNVTTSGSNNQIGGLIEDSEWGANARDPHFWTEIRGEKILPYLIKVGQKTAMLFMPITHGAGTRIDAVVNGRPTTVVTGSFFGGESLVGKECKVELSFTKGGLNDGEKLLPLTFSAGPGVKNKTLGGVLSRLGPSFVMRHILSYTMKATPEADKWAVGYIVEQACLQLIGRIADLLDSDIKADLSNSIDDVILMFEKDFKDAGDRQGLKEKLAEVTAELKEFLGSSDTAQINESAYSRKQLLEGLVTAFENLDGRWRLRYSAEEGALKFTEGKWAYDNKTGKYTWQPGAQKAQTAAASAGTDTQALKEDFIRAYEESSLKSARSSAEKGLIVYVDENSKSDLAIAILAAKAGVPVAVLTDSQAIRDNLAKAKMPGIPESCIQLFQIDDGPAIEEAVKYLKANFVDITSVLYYKGNRGDTVSTYKLKDLGGIVITQLKTPSINTGADLVNILNSDNLKISGVTINDAEWAVYQKAVTLAESV